MFDSKAEPSDVSACEMRPSLPSDFVLTATDATALASEFTRLAQNVDLYAVESLLPSLSTESGCYLWLLCHEGSQFKVYLGGTRSIRRRVKDYGLEFQLHSPNDFKLRLFYSFMAEWWPVHPEVVSDIAGLPAQEGGW